MKKVFKKPEIKICILSSKDVITTSGEIYQDNELPLVPIPQTNDDEFDCTIWF